jgi:hypothetical protein
VVAAIALDVDEPPRRGIADRRVQPVEGVLGVRMRAAGRDHAADLDGQATPAECGHELLLSLRRVDLSERVARGCTPKVLLLDLSLQYAGYAAQAAW